MLPQSIFQNRISFLSIILVSIFAAWYLHDRGVVLDREDNVEPDRIFLATEFKRSLKTVSEVHLSDTEETSSSTAESQLAMTIRPLKNSRFRTLQQFKPEYCPNQFTQYESERTGMRVVVVDQEGPKLHGFFVLATEIHDDSGAPHTLEHLCFMGSKNYRYKGFLDKLATRAYSGTNAWTATDHTAYTLETAGWAGFAQILPVYLEHVIAPTLTDAGCLTEVHHIDGEGNDAGVVYSEMQGIQNSASELMDLRAKRTMYAEKVGFRYETGGMMEQLRNLTAQRIRDFHREMYQPKNLCVALFGEINHHELLDILDQFETTILDVIPSPDAPFKRPWIDSRQAEPLKQTITHTVEFPEEDESSGQIDIHFLGPHCADYLSMGALEVVLLYLAGSSAAVLDNTLVEKEQLASGVYYQTDRRPRTEISFILSSVETGKLKEVEARFFDVLKDAMNKDLDMNLMQDCIHRYVRSHKFNTEATSTAFADHVIADFLYGNRDGSTLKTIASLKEYEEVLVQWTQDQWRAFIKKWISDAHHVSILGVPSQKLSEKLKKDEVARLEAQKDKLGPKGLKRKAAELEEAKAENDQEIPEEMLGHFKVPSTESIHFVNTISARVGPALKIGKPHNKYQNIIDEDSGSTKLFMDFEHIPSNFVRVNLLMATDSLPLELRPLLPIYLEAFFVLPIERDGKKISFEEVVTELDRDTVGYGIDFGSNLGSVEGLKVSFQVELEKYETAISWLRELLFDAIFDVERLMAINERLVADIPEAKRSGNDMLTAVHLMVHLLPESTGRASSTLVKALCLKRIRKMLLSEPEAVIQQMEELRSKLCRFENFRAVIIADLDKLKNPVSAWKPFLKGLDTSKDLLPLGKRKDKLSEAGQHPGKLAYVVPMPPIDSSFGYSTASGPDSFDDPRLPALMVAISYMNAVEGPLWVAVRGTGLAYGTSLSYDIESGFIHLHIYRSPEAFKALDASRRIVEAHVDGTIPFDPLMLEGAISSIVVNFANDQGTLASAAQASFVRQVIRGLPADYMEKMLKRVREVSPDAIKAALKNVVLDLFVPGKADILITCAPGLAEVSIPSNLRAGIIANVHFRESVKASKVSASNLRLMISLTSRTTTA